MLNFFPDYITEAVKPDIIIETSAGTYMGWINRSQLDRTIAAEGQPVWRIRFVEQTTDSEDKSQVRILYPNGDKEYNYVWNERESLTYQYAN